MTDISTSVKLWFCCASFNKETQSVWRCCIFESSPIVVDLLLVDVDDDEYSSELVRLDFDFSFLLTTDALEPDVTFAGGRVFPDFSWSPGPFPFRPCCRSLHFALLCTGSSRGYFGHLVGRWFPFWLLSLAYFVYVSERVYQGYTFCMVAITDIKLLWWLPYVCRLETAMLFAVSSMRSPNTLEDFEQIYCRRLLGCARSDGTYSFVQYNRMEFEI